MQEEFERDEQNIMNTKLKGVVQSELQPAGDKRITFVLFDELARRNIPCLSTLRFDRSIRLNAGDQVVLVGDWVADPSTGHETHFVCAAASRLEP